MESHSWKFFVWFFVFYVYKWIYSTKITFLMTVLFAQYTPSGKCKVLFFCATFFLDSTFTNHIHLLVCGLLGMFVIRSICLDVGVCVNFLTLFYLLHLKRTYVCNEYFEYIFTEEELFIFGITIFTWSKLPWCK